MDAEKKEAAEQTGSDVKPQESVENVTENVSTGAAAENVPAPVPSTDVGAQPTESAGDAGASAAAEASVAKVPVPPAPVPVPSVPTPQASAPATAIADTEAAMIAAATAGAANEATKVAASKIAIGSQRDAANPTLKPSQPRAVIAAKSNPVLLGDQQEVVAPEPAATIVNEPIGFSDGDVDAMEAELAAMSMDAVLEGVQAAEELELEENTRLKATVAKIDGDNVFFKLKGQFEGIASLEHFKKEPEIGGFVDVIVRSLNKDDGLYEVSIPGSSVSVGNWDDLVEGSVIDATISGTNTGGLEAMVGGIRAFMPASQISRFRVESDQFGEYVGKKLPCVVVEVNEDKRRLVLSHRGVLERENEEKKAQLLEEIEVGQLREGIVTKLMDFGAFVDLGGIEGLIHISKLSWDRVKHPSDVVKEGQQVRVKIEKIDIDNGRLSLSHRDTLSHPWQDVDTKFRVNEIVTGKVTKIADFGCFVKLASGVEGLVHISELAYHRVSRVSSVVSEGDEVSVKIISIDPQSQKMSLSIKQTMTPPTPKKSGKKEEEGPPEERELRVQKTSDEPLKGGTGRSTGGEQFGLKW